MALDSDIRDQAYHFFIQEAPELLQVIEADLLTLRQERSTAKVHNMMRAAHSIKGGAASVGLETIKTLAHSLEDIFKGLHNEELKIDAEVENLLLQAYDCLRFPLMEQITTGQFNSNQAMAMAEPVFAQIEAQLGEFLKGSADLPSSVELGVDITLSIFEVDVAQGLECLVTVLADPQGKEVAGELRAQAEVFAGLAELLNLPGFGAIAQTALAALKAHPDQALQITQLALADFQAAQKAVIAGDRTQGGAPSNALAELANSSAPLLPSLDDIFGDFTLTPAPDHPITSDQQDNSQELIQQFLDAELVEQAPIVSEANSVNSFADEVDITIPDSKSFTESSDPLLPSLDDIFGDFALTPAAPDQSLTTAQPQELHGESFAESSDPLPYPDIKAINAQDITQEIVRSIEQTFDSLPPIQANATSIDTAIVPAPVNLPAVQETTAIVSAPANKPAIQLPEGTVPTAPNPQLSVRVDIERLERMNNLVGELSINRNGLSLQNEHLQATVQELLRRFAKFQQMGHHLRNLSDQMLVAPERGGRTPTTGRIKGQFATNDVDLTPSGRGSFRQADFDSLEMDSYGELHLLLQATLEEMVQLEETVGDVVLLAGQSSQKLEGQRQMLGHLRDDLMWARMLPLGEVFNRFPRMLRDLSTSYDKPVELKLSGTRVLVDKAALEKLYDPLLHLLRNAFDHGIEPPEVRRQHSKRAQGQIELRAYHQGSQTIIEVRDDGRGLNLERIRNRALDMGLLSPEQVATASTSRLLELLFEPGFSTASQVSELSGRGVGLDVVRSQLRSLKGSVSVTSEPGCGTTFTLRIPLTLTIAKLLVGFVGSTAFALPSDSITEILIPQPDQVKQSGGQRFLHWGERIVPAYYLSEVLKYACPLPEAVPSFGLEVVPSPEDWAPPMLLLEQDDQVFALEIDRLVTEQELVIKPLEAAIAPPSYIYGCTILGDGSLVPVFDSAALLNHIMGHNNTAIGATTANLLASVSEHSSTANITYQRDIAPTVLVVDDSITLRQTLALTLQKAGYRVLQARDGREAIDQLGQNSKIQLVVCDIEMPNMNGFEFLSHRRQDPLISKSPVVMLTSRSSDKHRQLAMHLGAKAYFTKPYIEQEFLAAIKAMITQYAPVGVPALAHSS